MESTCKQECLLIYLFVSFSETLKFSYSESAKLKAAELMHSIGNGAVVIKTIQNAMSAQRSNGESILTAKGIYGQGLYNTETNDEEARYTESIFEDFKAHLQSVETVKFRLKMSKYEREEKFKAIASKKMIKLFRDTYYVKSCMQNCLRLRFSSLNLNFRTFYYVRHIFNSLSLSQRCTLMRFLRTADVFDKLQMFGYSLLLYDNQYVDYYTFKMYQSFCDEFAPMDDGSFRLTTEMTNALAVDFLDSDIVDCVARACDLHLENSTRERMPYAKSFPEENDD